jgi:hypothetical protein
MMINLGFQVCDRIKSASNFTPWKCRLQILLEEVDLLKLVEKKVTLPTNPLSIPRK